VELLAAKEVRFAAYVYFLSQLGVAREALLESIEIVSSGVGELVKKQAEGWAFGHNMS
jgi:intracellular sulfur oxidation DsrE/DsrF family protein